MLTLQELRRQIKETWLKAKNLADAKREELTALLRGGGESAQAAKERRGD